MKKLTALLLTIAVIAVSSVFIAPLASATDVCSNTPHSSADFYVENIKPNWLLSMSCVDSEILTTMPTGSVMHVIGKTEGWHKLVTEDGLIGWMWEDFVAPTSKTFNPTPEPEPEPYVEPEPVEYVAMRDIAGHKYEDAIWYVYNNDIVEGYEDGSYKPDQTINRAELLKIIVEAKYNNEFEAYDNQGCFTDVAASQWYSKYVCFGLSKYVVEGYTDGSFKPANEINFVESLKLALIGFGIGYEPGDPWYRLIVEEATEANLIPLDVDKFDDILTRGQIAEMITRIMKYEDETLADYLGAMVDSKITYEMLEY
ncbi:S-layer homology domain-containing protein [Patescibacteria group bacterium]